MAELCAARGVDLSDQMDFGGSLRELFPDSFREEHPAETGEGEGQAVQAAAAFAAPASPARRGAPPVPRRRAAAGVPGALEEPLHPSPRCLSVLLRRRAHCSHERLPGGLELASHAGHPRRARGGPVPRILLEVLVLPHRAQGRTGAGSRPQRLPVLTRAPPLAPPGSDPGGVPGRLLVCPSLAPVSFASSEARTAPESRSPCRATEAGSRCGPLQRGLLLGRERFDCRPRGGCRRGRAGSG